MAKLSKSTSFSPVLFLVPDEKINYDTSVQLGNVIYRVTDPEIVLSKPRRSHHCAPSASSPQSNNLKTTASQSEIPKFSKYGLVAKILDLLGFGANVSRRGAKAASESYEAKSMKISTFTPPKEFLSSVG